MNLREFPIMLRKRKIKPDKGRCKDIRKIDLIIQDMLANTHPELLAND